MQEFQYIQGESLKKYHYTVFFEPEPGGGYNVIVPAIPEICTFGEILAACRTFEVTPNGHH